MTDRPILFSGPMVRALLDGRKTQTRRVLKPQPDMAKISQLCHPEERAPGRWVWMARDDAPGYSYATADFKVRFAKGDRLWVRETLREADDGCWLYDADKQTVDLPAGDPRIPEMIAWAHHKESGHCVSIHMPRWASRLTLTVTDVRIERLQAISETDARAEGVEAEVFDQAPAARNYGADDAWFIHWGTIDDPDVYTDIDVLHRRSFASLWNRINGPGSWDANPWVVAVSFDVAQRNIDA